MPTILTIDDTRLTHHVVRLALAHEAHTLVSARDGIEGVRTAAQIHPDLVILGRTLPAMDGPMVLEHLHDENPALRAIVIGAGLSQETCAALTRLGATAFLDRPIDAQRLRFEVAAALAEIAERPAAA